MGQRQNDAQLLTHPSRHLADLDLQIQIESGSQIFPRTHEITAANVTKDFQRRRTIHPRWQTQIAWYVAYVVFDRFTLVPATAAKDPRLATAGPQKAEEYSNCRGLSCAVRAKEAEQRPLGNLE